MAQLNDICELNSILHIEEQAKEELANKKIVLTAALKQQESRFYLELDERTRFEDAVSETQNVLEKLISDHEIAAVTANQIAEFAATEQSKNISDRTESYAQEQFATLQRVLKLSEKVQIIEAHMNESDKICVNKVDAQLTVSQSELENLSYAFEKCIQSGESLLVKRHEKEARRKSCQSRLVTVQQDKDKAVSDAAILKNDLKHHEATVERLKSAVEEKRATKIKNDGLHAERLTAVQDSIAVVQEKEQVEVKTTEAIDVEIAALQQLHQTLIGSCELVKQKLTATEKAVEEVRCAAHEREQVVKELERNLRDTTSEIDTTNTTQRSNATHSFKDKADALKQELDQLKAQLQDTTTQFETVQKELADNDLHPRLSELQAQLGSHVESQRAAQSGMQELKLTRSAAAAKKDRIETDQKTAEGTGVSLAVSRKALNDQALQSQEVPATPDVDKLQQTSSDQETQIDQLRKARAVLDKDAEQMSAALAEHKAKAVYLESQEAEYSKSEIKKYVENQKQSRVNKIREERIAEYRVEINGLKKLLHDEDRSFQASLQKNTSQLKTTADELGQEEEQLMAALADKEKTAAPTKKASSDKRLESTADVGPERASKMGRSQPRGAAKGVEKKRPASQTTDKVKRGEDLEEEEHAVPAKRKKPTVPTPMPLSPPGDDDAHADMSVASEPFSIFKEPSWGGRKGPRKDAAPPLPEMQVQAEVRHSQVEDASRRKSMPPPSSRPTAGRLPQRKSVGAPVAGSYVSSSSAPRNIVTKNVQGKAQSRMRAMGNVTNKKAQ